MSGLLEKTTVSDDTEKEDETTEEAPYGYKADGTPKKRPGRPAGSGGYTRKAAFSDTEKDKLADRFVEYLGPPVSFASPLAFAVLEDRAEKTANALIQLAKTRPRVAKFIRGMIEGSATVDIALTGVGMLTAIGVEIQRIRPDSMVSHYFKIDDFYVQMYGEMAENIRNGTVERHGMMEELG